MAARLLRSSISLLLLLIELRYSLSRLLANPLTIVHAVRFQALRARWTIVQALEISLNEELSDAKAQVDIADAALDDFAVRFSNALLALTGQKRDAVLYVFFFKKPLSEFRKPILAGQLQAMTDWILSLDTTPHPTLAAMKAELITLVEAGQKATKVRDTLLLKIRDFRDVGERKQLFDEVNAERKSVEGELSKLALQTPSLGTAFSQQFFKPSEAGDATEETIDSVTLEIKDLEAKLAERALRLVEITKEAEDAAKKAEDKAAKTARLAELNKDIEARKKEAQALKDELS
jgi:hypothetical protein